MYEDTKPCRVCGAEVELRPRETADAVIESDGTVDERVCTNNACPTRSGGADRQA